MHTEPVSPVSPSIDERVATYAEKALALPSRLLIADHRRYAELSATCSLADPLWPLYSRLVDAAAAELLRRIG